MSKNERLIIFIVLAIRKRWRIYYNRTCVESVFVKMGNEDVGRPVFVPGEDEIGLWLNAGAVGGLEYFGYDGVAVRKIE